MTRARGQQVLSCVLSFAVDLLGNPRMQLGKPPHHRDIVGSG